MAQFMQANGTDNLTKNEEFRKLSQNLRIATDNYNEYRRVVNANNAELNNKTAEKDKLANIKAVNKLKQEELKLQQEQQKAEAKMSLVQLLLDE